MYNVSYVHSGIPFKGKNGAILKFEDILELRTWIKWKLFVILVESHTHK